MCHVTIISLHCSTNYNIYYYCDHFVHVLTKIPPVKISMFAKTLKTMQQVYNCVASVKFKKVS